MEENYHFSVVNDTTEYNVAYKSVLAGYADSVNIVLPKSIKYSDLTFLIADSTYQLESVRRSRDTITIVLPIMNSNYSLDVLIGDTLKGKLRVIVYPERIIKVVVIPIIRTKFDADSLERYLNKVYQQSGLTISLDVQPYFKTTEFTDTILSNPSPDNDRFTNQMIDIRDEFFEDHPDDNKNAYYIFLTNGFVNKKQKAYSFVTKLFPSSNLTSRTCIE